MSLPDDSSVASDQLAEIRAAADRLLREGGAFECFPTPVDQIMRAAKVEIVPLQLDDGYLARLRQKAEAAGTALLSALSKVWGVFDPKARVAFIDPETPKNKLPFLKLHEGGHAVLPWQSIFGIFEDCRKTLDPDVKAQFEREANVFASEVLFQRNTFTVEARDLAVGLKGPPHSRQAIWGVGVCHRPPIRLDERPCLRRSRLRPSRCRPDGDRQHVASRRDFAGLRSPVRRLPVARSRHAGGPVRLHGTGSQDDQSAVARPDGCER
ncbi:ImmA/IrrE family metallo-endopeptidase [Bradyrhizobium sp. USDA 4519]